MFASRQVGRITCLQTRNGVASVFKPASLPRPSLRRAATTAKPRAKKVPSAGDDSVSIPKKTLSTKSPVATATKSPRKKSTTTPALPVAPDASTPFTTAKKSTRTTTTKVTPVSTKPLRPSDASTGKPLDEPKLAVASKARSSKLEGTGKTRTPSKEPTATLSKTAATGTSLTGSTISSVKSSTITSGQVPQPSSNTSVKPLPRRGPISPPTPQQSPSSNSPPKTGPSSPEFKRASRKVTSVIVALPILLVTTYYLFDRLVLGNQPKRLSDFRSTPEVPPVSLEQDKNGV